MSDENAYKPKVLSDKSKSVQRAITMKLAPVDIVNHLEHYIVWNSDHPLKLWVDTATIFSLMLYWEMDTVLYTRASGKRWSAETKVRKRKYRNRSTEVRTKATYRCLVPYSVLLTHDYALCKRWTVFKWCESRVLTHWTLVCTNTVV